MQKENGKMSFGHIFPCTPVMHDIDELASRKPISTWPLRCTRTYGTHASTWATWGAHINTHQHGPPGCEDTLVQTELGGLTIFRWPYADGYLRSPSTTQALNTSKKCIKLA